MSTYLSENLNEREVVHGGPARLHGYSLTSTGREPRYVAFIDGDRTAALIVVPAGEERSISGLNEPYPAGLAVESLRGDGTLIANVFYEEREPVIAALLAGMHEEHE